MRIAFITTEYMTEKEFDGGLANYLNRVIQALTHRGHDIEIFTLSEENNTLRHNNLPVHQVANESRLFQGLNRLTRYKLKRFFRFLGLASCLKKSFLKRHAEKPFDIIQASSCFGCGLFLTFKPPVPLVTRVSSYEPLFREYYKVPLTTDQKLAERVELIAIKRSCRAYAPSQFLADIISKKHKRAIDVIQPPFDLNLKDFDESVFNARLKGKIYFLFYGTIGFLKGVEILAQSIPHVCREFDDVHFVFAGKIHNGPRNQNMMEYVYAKAGAFKNHVHHLGSLSHHVLFPIIKNSFAVVLPSLVDNFPNTMLESMALGKIVIGTTGTSMDEFIEDQKNRVH